MSDGRYEIERAISIAEDVKSKLQPYCERIQIAGSIRRECATVGDIEIVCIPKTVMTGLFYDEIERDPGFVRQVRKWRRVKGDPGTGKYTQRIIEPSGIKLDLFMATRENWGLILAIRTGSAEFSSKRLARRWVQLGYHSKDGMLQKDGVDIPVRNEQDLFDKLGIEWVEPRERR